MVLNALDGRSEALREVENRVSMPQTTKHNRAQAGVTYKALVEVELGNLLVNDSRLKGKLDTPAAPLSIVPGPPALERGRVALPNTVDSADPGAHVLSNFEEAIERRDVLFLLLLAIG